MSSIQAAVSAASRQIDIDLELERIFRKYFELDSEKNKNNVGYQSWGLQAVAVSIAISNLFIAVNNSGSGRNYRAITDLAYGLHTNDFWSRSSAFLMPLVTVALNAHKDYESWRAEKVDTGEYALYQVAMAGAKGAPLEVFSGILYMVGGPSLMLAASGPLKLELAPYILA